MKRSSLLAICLGLAGASVATPGAASTTVTLVPTPAGRAGELGLAPDGKPGFGPGRSLAELLHPFRQPGDVERRWLAELGGLPAAIDTLAIVARDRYAKRGYFELLGANAEIDLAALHTAFRAAEADAPAILAKGDARSKAFARMYFDVRFALRAAALERYADERGELDAALGVLRGATDGHVQLVEAEARRLADRADLAASFLRAIESDLRTLHVPKPELDVESDTLAKADELVALAVAREKDRERAFELAARIDELARAKRRMTETLATTALAAKLAQPLAARSKALDDAGKLTVAARQHFEEPANGVTPPADVVKLSRSDRLRVARELASRALAKDPLDDEATWILAETVDYFDGELYSRPHYDRYLALRGIRAHRWETIRDRDLTHKEQKALDVVQRATQPPVR
ncbi:MAG: hypothetical protein L6Q99_18275 [Planctomycetes bacterium]|nr:hypothetical protein [Planctomycetota bacterium]